MLLCPQPCCVLPDSSIYFLSHKNTNTEFQYQLFVAMFLLFVNRYAGAEMCSWTKIHMTMCAGYIRLPRYHLSDRRDAGVCVCVTRGARVERREVRARNGEGGWLWGRSKTGGRCRGVRGEGRFTLGGSRERGGLYKGG